MRITWISCSGCWLFDSVFFFYSARMRKQGRKSSMFGFGVTLHQAEPDPNPQCLPATPPKCSFLPPSIPSLKPSKKSGSFRGNGSPLQLVRILCDKLQALSASPLNPGTHHTREATTWAKKLHSVCSCRSRTCSFYIRKKSMVFCIH